MNDTDSNLVLIYQMGKVGSKTIVATLKAAGLTDPIYSVHFLSPTQIENVEQCYVKWGKPAKLDVNRKILSLLADSRRHSRIKVITLVREYVAREISDYFTKIRWLKSDLPVENEDTSHSVEMISSSLKEYFSSFDPTKDYACTWFDKELKEVFGFDIFRFPFNREKGYQIYYTGRADILCIRLEDLSSCFRQAFKEFLNIDGCELIKKNEAVGKESYSELYQRVLNNFRLEEPLLGKIYSSRLMMHFYGGDRIEQFKNRWRQEAVEAAFNAGKYRRIRIVHPQGKYTQDPELSRLVRILCREGYIVDMGDSQAANFDLKLELSSYWDAKKETGQESLPTAAAAEG